ncbi:MAG: HEAT repeat domain-containing protein [Myxococcota bacterium]
MSIGWIVVCGLGWSASLDSATQELVYGAPPALVEAVSGWQPGPTRAGSLRLYGSPDADPDLVSALVAQRLLDGQDTIEVQGALVDYLARTRQYADLARQLWDERPALRPYLVVVFQDAPDALALQALQLAFDDADPMVRAEAARVAGYRRDLPLNPMLTQALDDDVVEVRAFAARTLGWRGDRSVFVTLQSYLDDPAPEVRLNLLRAMERLAPDVVGKIDDIAHLTLDPDPRVARAAEQIRHR